MTLLAPSQAAHGSGLIREKVPSSLTGKRVRFREMMENRVAIELAVDIWAPCQRFANKVLLEQCLSVVWSLCSILHQSLPAKRRMRKNWGSLNSPHPKECAGKTSWFLPWFLASLPVKGALPHPWAKSAQANQNHPLTCWAESGWIWSAQNTNLFQEVSKKANTPMKVYRRNPPIEEEMSLTWKCHHFAIAAEAFHPWSRNEFYVLLMCKNLRRLAQIHCTEKSEENKWKHRTCKHKLCIFYIIYIYTYN